MASPADKRDLVAQFIVNLYKYYVRRFAPAGQQSNGVSSLPPSPITISTILVEECHAVAATLARAMHNKCPRLRLI